MSIPSATDRAVTLPLPRSVDPEPPIAPARAEPSAEPSPFAQLLHGLGHEVKSGEGLVRGALASGAGGELDAGALLALQAGVYRYSQSVDLASRFVEQATNGVKTVLQGQ